MAKLQRFNHVTYNNPRHHHRQKPLIQTTRGETRFVRTDNAKGVMLGWSLALVLTLVAYALLVATGGAA